MLSYTLRAVCVAGRDVALPSAYRHPTICRHIMCSSEGFGVVALRGTRLEALCGAACLIASRWDQVAEHVWVCLIWLGYTAGTSNGRCLQQPAVAFDRDGLRVHANSACTIFGNRMSRPAAACAAMYACRGRWQMRLQYHPQTALQGTPLQALSFLFVSSVPQIWWLQCHHSGTVARAWGLMCTSNQQ